MKSRAGSRLLPVQVIDKHTVAYSGYRLSAPKPFEFVRIFQINPLQISGTDNHRLILRQHDGLVRFGVIKIVAGQPVILDTVPLWRIGTEITETDALCPAIYHIFFQ